MRSALSWCAADVWAFRSNSLRDRSNFPHSFGNVGTFIGSHIFRPIIARQGPVSIGQMRFRWPLPTHSSHACVCVPRLVPAAVLSE